MLLKTCQKAAQTKFKLSVYIHVSGQHRRQRALVERSSWFHWGSCAPGQWSLWRCTAQQWAPRWRRWCSSAPHHEGRSPSEHWTAGPLGQYLRTKRQVYTFLHKHEFLESLPEKWDLQSWTWGGRGIRGVVIGNKILYLVSSWVSSALHNTSSMGSTLYVMWYW